MKPTPEHLDLWEHKWIPALRGDTRRRTGGKYKQVPGYLHTKHGFCCLGVLCDVAMPKLRWKMVVQTDVMGLPERYGNESRVIPIELRSEFGIDAQTLPLTERAADRIREELDIGWESIGPVSSLYRDEPYVRALKLAPMNDNGVSFDRIADAIQIAVEEWRAYYASVEAEVVPTAV